MRSIVLLFALLSVACALLTTEEQFSAWMAEYGKVYSAEEYPTRFNNFKSTLERNIKLNAESDGAVFGLNKFADMSDKEFKSTILMKKFIDIVENDATEQTFIPAPGAPETFDWRTTSRVTAVKDQG
jgi:C1A family cysteine protease